MSERGKMMAWLGAVVVGIFLGMMHVMTSYGDDVRAGEQGAFTLPAPEATARARYVTDIERMHPQGRISIETWRAIKAALEASEKQPTPTVRQFAHPPGQLKPCAVFWSVGPEGFIWVSVQFACVWTFGGGISYIVDARQGYRVVGRVPER